METLLGVEILLLLVGLRPHLPPLPKLLLWTAIGHQLLTEEALLREILNHSATCLGFPDL